LQRLQLSHIPRCVHCAIAAAARGSCRRSADFGQ
jgi:hypothetical protein